MNDIIPVPSQNPVGSGAFDNFYVQSEHVMRPDFPADKSVGQFSSHWAAVAALIRLRDDPKFRSLSGDSAEDLREEQLMRTLLSMSMLDKMLGIGG